MKSVRELSKFDPWWELGNRWPDWRIVPAPIRAGEVWVWNEKMVLVPNWDRALTRRTVAHVCAHLSLSHRGPFTRQQESDARDWVRLHLDEWSLDGSRQRPVDEARTSRPEDQV